MGDYLLKEDSDKILLETGDGLLLDIFPAEAYIQQQTQIDSLFPRPKVASY